MHTDLLILRLSAKHNSNSKRLRSTIIYSMFILYFLIIFHVLHLDLNDKCLFLHITAQQKLDLILSVTNWYAFLFVCIWNLYPARNYEARWDFIGWERVRFCSEKHAVVGRMLMMTAGAIALSKWGSQYRWLGGDCMNNILFSESIAPFQSVDWMWFKSNYSTFYV